MHTPSTVLRQATQQTRKKENFKSLLILLIGETHSWPDLTWLADNNSNSNWPVQGYLSFFQRPASSSMDNETGTYLHSLPQESDAGTAVVVVVAAAAAVAATSHLLLLADVARSFDLKQHKFVEVMAAAYDSLLGRSIYIVRWPNVFQYERCMQQLFSFQQSCFPLSLSSFPLNPWKPGQSVYVLTTHIFSYCPSVHPAWADLMHTRTYTAHTDTHDKS